MLVLLINSYCLFQIGKLQKHEKVHLAVITNYFTPPRIISITDSLLLCRQRLHLLCRRQIIRSLVGRNHRMSYLRLQLLAGISRNLAALTGHFSTLSEALGVLGFANLGGRCFRQRIQCQLDVDSVFLCRDSA